MTSSLNILKTAEIWAAHQIGSAEVSGCDPTSQREVRA